jgi:hypothetical protein
LASFAGFGAEAEPPGNPRQVGPLIFNHFCRFGSEAGPPGNLRQIDPLIFNHFCRFGSKNGQKYRLSAVSIFAFQPAPFSSCVFINLINRFVPET